jgi:hypothetical protein
MMNGANTLTQTATAAPVCLYGTLSESSGGTKVSLFIKPNLLQQYVLEPRPKS